MWRPGDIERRNEQLFAEYQRRVPPRDRLLRRLEVLSLVAEDDKAAVLTAFDAAGEAVQPTMADQPIDDLIEIARSAGARNRPSTMPMSCPNPLPFAPV